MLTPTGLRAHLNAPGDSFNAVVGLPDAGVAAVIGSCGYDYVVLDGEHGPFTVESMRSCIDALRSVGSATVVRVADGDPGTINRALDLGADGVQIPQIRRAAQAVAAVAAARYSPEGHRGVGGGHASHYGADGGAYRSSANAGVGVLAMIEDAEGVANAAEIARVDGIDTIVIGMLDLSADLGVMGQIDHPSVVEAVGAVVDAAVAAGTRVGTGCPPDDVTRFRGIGMTSFSCFFDGAALGAAARSALHTARAE